MKSKETRSEIIRSLRTIFEYRGNPITPFGINTVTAGPGAGVQWGPIVSFPFRTKIAEAVWAAVPKVLKLNPDQPVDEVIRLATIEANVFTFEMTPEDMKLLEIAVGWMKTQKSKSEEDVPEEEEEERNTAGSSRKTTV